MIISEFTVEYRRFCHCRCDECGNSFTRRIDILKKGNSTRKCDKHLCRKCVFSTKYRNCCLTARGDKHPRWKGGLSQSRGYRFVYVDFENKQEPEHRVIAKKEYKGLPKGTVVHHINGDKADNSPANLWPCTRNEHAQIHNQMERLGFSLLGELIWYDVEHKQYVLTRTTAAPLVLKRTNIQLASRKKHRRKRGRLVYELGVLPDGKKRYFHVLKAEAAIQRRLTRSEIVHHIDGNTLNNDINNLHVMTRQEHSLAHFSLQRCVEELVRIGEVTFNAGNYARQVKDSL